MPDNSQEIKKDDVTVRLDRLQILARPWGDQLPVIPGFRICRDSFVHSQTAFRTYTRVRNLKNRKTGTDMYLQYRPVPPWLEPVKFTVIADDSAGLQRSELETICSLFKWIRVLTVELAIDFSEASGIGRSFVLRHGLFGRSRFVGRRLFMDLRYGTRHSETMVRCYKKPQLGSYRVELELHSAWLRKSGIETPEDLSRLPSLLVAKRIMFVAVDWAALADCLEKKGYSSSFLKKCRSEARSLQEVREQIQVEAGPVNLRRFLRPLPVNAEIKRQLRRWANRWCNSSEAGL